MSIDFCVYFHTKDMVCLLSCCGTTKLFFSPPSIGSNKIDRLEAANSEFNNFSLVHHTFHTVKHFKLREPKFLYVDTDVK